MKRRHWIILVDVASCALLVFLFFEETNIWVLALLAVLAGAAAIYYIRDVNGSRAERRWRAGQCLQCGYQLHGNTSRACPECGSVIATDGH